jgi:hypothetical protein
MNERTILERAAVLVRVTYLAAGAGGDHAPAGGEVGLRDPHGAAACVLFLLVPLPDDLVPLAAGLAAVGGRWVHVTGADGLGLAHAADLWTRKKSRTLAKKQGVGVCNANQGKGFLRTQWPAS